MGIHWYASSTEWLAIERALTEAEGQIFAPAADKRAIDIALANRTTLLERGEAARLALERRGRDVTIEETRAWPSRVFRHVQALGASESDRGFLEILGWSTDYYVENLRDCSVPMEGVSQPLERLDISPREAKALAGELLGYVYGLTVSGEPDSRRAEVEARTAGWCLRC